MTSSRSLISQTLPLGPVNVGPTERIVTAGVGGALLLLGLDRGRGAGTLMALAGTVLLARAATGHCPAYQMMQSDGDGGGRFAGGRAEDFARDDFANAELAARGRSYRPAPRRQDEKAEVLSGPHPSAGRKPDVAREDMVEHASEYSFPASDPPSFTGGSRG